MTIDFNDFYRPKPKQLLAHKCRAKYLLLGGGMGSGKSWWLMAEAIKQLTKHAGNRIVIVRKELSVLRRTSLVTFLSICPPDLIASFNQTTLEIKFINGSVLTFLDANIAKDPLLQKLKGLEISWFGIDEANEVSIEVYQLLKTRLRWILPNGQTPSYEGRLTSNPEPCWLINTFIHSTNPDEKYIQSLTTDNYDENSDYVTNLKSTFKDTPNLLRKYLYGDWSLTDSINQLIPAEYLQRAIQKIDYGVGISCGIDCARYGDDKTVFTVLKEGNIELIESHNLTSITEVTTRAIELINQYNIDSEYVGVDSIGMGAGVFDGLKSAGYNIIEIIGGSKAIETTDNSTFKPFNLRTQMYYELRKDIMESNLGNLYHEGLRYELQAIKYEICSDRTTRVVSKDVIKRLLGRSPDFADSLAYANWVRTFRGEFYGYVPMYGGG